MIPDQLNRWLRAVVAKAPKSVRLLYVEWNDGRHGSQKVLWFNAFGYRMADFDPEDSASLSGLADWDWEFADSCAIAPKVGADQEALRRAMEELFAADRSILDPLLRRGGLMAFGRHESSVSVFPPLDRPQTSTCYYELHVALKSNSVDTVEFSELDSDALDEIIEYRRFRRPYPKDASFHLQSRGTEMDLLAEVRYLVCSERMCALIEGATDKCQVYPIQLYRSKTADPTKQIPGYYVVNLYEQLRCLDPATVLPPPYEDFLPTFDPSVGYRIVRAKVGKRDIFRIAYEHRRLVVSHAFRIKCEHVGITGVEWLRRESI